MYARPSLVFLAFRLWAFRDGLASQTKSAIMATSDDVIAIIGLLITFLSYTNWSITDVIGDVSLKKME